jgi:hypothetical protein
MRHGGFLRGWSSLAFMGHEPPLNDFIVIIVGAIISMKTAEQAKPEFVCTAVK